MKRYRLSWLHLVVVLFVFLWLRSCSEKQQLQNEISHSTKALSDSIVYYKNKNGEEVASKLALKGDVTSLEMLLSSNRDSLHQLKKLARHYKNVAAAVRTETVTEIKEIEVPYIIEGADFSVPFKIQKEFYSLSGKSTNQGLFIDQFTIPNSQSIVIGDKKTGFWKTEYRIEVVNSNPYVTTTSVDGFNHTEKNKRFGVGFQAGYGISGNGIGPYIGVGVSYSVIRF